MFLDQDQPGWAVIRAATVEPRLHTCTVTFSNSLVSSGSSNDLIETVSGEDSSFFSSWTSSVPYLAAVVELNSYPLTGLSPTTQPSCPSFDRDHYRYINIYISIDINIDIGIDRWTNR